MLQEECKVYSERISWAKRVEANRDELFEFLQSRAVSLEDGLISMIFHLC